MARAAPHSPPPKGGGAGRTARPAPKDYDAGRTTTAGTPVRYPT